MPIFPNARRWQFARQRFIERVPLDCLRKLAALAVAGALALSAAATPSHAVEEPAPLRQKVERLVSELDAGISQRSRGRPRRADDDGTVDSSASAQG